MLMEYNNCRLPINQLCTTIFPIIFCYKQGCTVIVLFTLMKKCTLPNTVQLRGLNNKLSLLTPTLSLSLHSFAKHHDVDLYLLIFTQAHLFLTDTSLL